MYLQDGSLGEMSTNQVEPLISLDTLTSVSA